MGDTGVVKRAAFLGSKKFGFDIFVSIFRSEEAISWTVICPDDARDSRSYRDTFLQFSYEHEIEIFFTESKQAANNLLLSLNIDIVLVCGWYYLLPVNVLQSVRYGFWGVHNSLLPKYRGGSPLVWSIINGESIVGSSVFRLSQEMDNGEILCQVEVTVEIEDNVESLMQKLSEQLQRALPYSWRNLIKNAAKTVKQNEEAATYCASRIDDDGLVNWSKSALQVHNFIRAQAHPYPCAFSYISGEKIRLAKSKMVEGEFWGTPGQVLKILQRGVVVACGNGTAIQLDTIFYEGQDSVPASQLITSLKTRFKAG